MLKRQTLFVALCLALFLCFTGAAAAQETSTSGILQMGQPAIGYVASPELPVNYTYELASPLAVTLQAIGDTARPSIAIYQNGVLVASQPNAEGAFIVNLTTFLNAGSYVVEVGIAGGEPGMVILIVQNETPVTVSPLTVGTAVTGEVTVQIPLALYSFSALPEPAYLYVESALETSGPNVRLVDTTTGSTIGTLNAAALGGRFRLPAGVSTFQAEVTHNASTSPVPFTLCFVAVSAGDCGAATVPVAQTPEVETPSADACTVTPNSGGANLRQSASVGALLVGALPGGATAEVLGISPDGTFYNINYNNLNAWVALSVVTASGNCAGVPVVNPPVIIPQPTIPPTSTPIPPSPVPPTTPPTNTPIPPSPTPAGPCLITMTGDQLVYTIPNAIPDNIYDQVHAGYELVPVGRLADNTWWRTNYANAWIETSTFGVTAAVSGDCTGLPIVTP